MAVYFKYLVKRDLSSKQHYCTVATLLTGYQNYTAIFFWSGCSIVQVHRIQLDSIVSTYLRRDDGTEVHNLEQC